MLRRHVAIPSAQFVELHHYTNEQGLRGILQSNTFWATDYRDLNDTTEVTRLESFLAEATAARLERKYSHGIKSSQKLQRVVRRHGGPGAAAEFHAANTVRLIKGVLYGDVADFGPTTCYITSFCSHANDSSYEERNGLLSQWRGYGGPGAKYCIVVDWTALWQLTGVETATGCYLSLDLSRVAYEGDAAEIEALVSDPAERLAELALTLSKAGKVDPREISPDLISDFAAATAKLKHQAFREEREVRIIAHPLTEIARQAFIARGGWPGVPRTKRVMKVPSALREKHYIRLFEGSKLPVKRIIVGPSLNQAADEERAKQMVQGRIPIVRSETPFIG